MVKIHKILFMSTENVLMEKENTFIQLNINFISFDSLFIEKI